VTTIGNSAFGECYSLQKITIPNSVSSIDKDAFWLCGYKQLFTLYCSRTTPPTLKGDIFGTSSGGEYIIYVPSSLVNKYKAANIWKNYYIWGIR
jgi:hypothetical protein